MRVPASFDIPADREGLTILSAMEITFDGEANLSIGSLAGGSTETSSKGVAFSGGSSTSPEEQLAKASVSVIAAAASPRGFQYSATVPSAVSVTVRAYSTVVVAAANTHRRSLTWQPSSTLISISQLSASKNHNRPESSEPKGTTRAAPTVSSKLRQRRSTRKRS